MIKVVRIIGVGNPLMGDDGIGIAAVERLAKMDLPEGVEVIDGGTGGMTLLHLMEGSQGAILVDAVDMGKPPGTVVRFTLDEVAMAERENPDFSLHETGLPQVFALGRELGTLPPVILFGVQPESIERRLGLSATAVAALEPLMECVLAELCPILP